jgi:hypothetical protein
MSVLLYNVIKAVKLNEDTLVDMYENVILHFDGLLKRHNGTYNSLIKIIDRLLGAILLIAMWRGIEAGKITSLSELEPYISDKYISISDIGDLLNIMVATNCHNKLLTKELSTLVNKHKRDVLIELAYKRGSWRYMRNTSCQCLNLST